MPSEKIQRAAVVGAGAWGTTFAQVLCDAGLEVLLWGRDPKLIETINEVHTSKYLSGIVLPENLRATSDISQVLEFSPQMLVVAIPSSAIEQALLPLAGQVSKLEIVSLVKGLKNGHFMSELIAHTLQVPQANVTVISGPNLAGEIAARQPAATVVANQEIERAQRVAEACDAGYFRPYISTDVIGCEIGGVAKNVIALAVGAATGMGLGKNTQSTLITRGLAEITRLGLALGANGETFLGLAGIGDLTTTCSSQLSRNFTFGENIGKGLSVQQALGASRGVAEGVNSCDHVLALAKENGVDMPITEAVVDVVHNNHSAAQMGERLLGRPRKMDGVEIQLA
ncbi:hypothetical protein BK816_03000 [Boudabousia tangfeifanii]|uniref:Glycerol-3-phosphate dehydrogenase [NAD(P)+] n=1 Tax=Boudabousia tangfeifanii TaxID=1912795 RepID=A0A1D9MJM4_9ACTO|nr:NAD(P)H-dependent glycerol-3-phosphate dehydrogenase [Boudabousia tangfeifanii]AOZ72389.1 hypothetical protein BK816_03000 [Boudabousia tangfeifanii]